MEKTHNLFPLSAVKDISNAYQLKSGKKMNTTDECREQTFYFPY